MYTDNIKPFLLKLDPGIKLLMRPVISQLSPEFKSDIENSGLSRFSVWNGDNYLFGYWEENGGDAAGIFDGLWNDYNLSRFSSCLARPGEMRLVCSSESGSSAQAAGDPHIFMAHLKPGCIEQFSRQYSALLEAQPASGRRSRLTVWNSGDLICGCHEYSGEAEPVNPIRATGLLRLTDWIAGEADWFMGKRGDKVTRTY